MKKLLLVVFFCLMAPLLLEASSETQPTLNQNYERLEKALEKFQKRVEGQEWPKVSKGPKLEVGFKGPRVLEVRKRLKASGEYSRDLDSDTYDEGLQKAVSQFQSEHGLEPDGKTGDATVRAFNVSPQERVTQGLVTLARLSEEKEARPARRIEVNIPEFWLRYFEDEKVALEMKVVIGQRKQWNTPTLSSSITHLVLHPKWNVPPGIMKKEMMGKLKKEPDYFVKNSMKVVLVKGEEKEVIDPTTFDWESNPDLGWSDFKIVQSSGDKNALGKIKFLFPNKFSVYLHDTPQQSGFKRWDRALSHGCVRLEKPLELARVLLSQNSDSWTYEKFQKALNDSSPKKNTEEIPEGEEADSGPKTQWVALKQSVPVYILYETVRLDEHGDLIFYEDLYGLNKKWATSSKSSDSEKK